MSTESTEKQSKNIFQAIPLIMAEVGYVEKLGRNTQGYGYDYRSVDDVMAALQISMARHGVFVVPEVLQERTEDRVSSKGNSLIYRVLKIKHYFYASDGSFVAATVIGEGMDSGDKASNKAMSVAFKYACCEVFCIPTKEPKDPEIETHEVDSSVYTGTDSQKKSLVKLFDKHKITDVDYMRQISDSAKESKIKMTDLEKFMKGGI